MRYFCLSDLTFESYRLKVLPIGVSSREQLLVNCLGNTCRFLEFIVISYFFVDYVIFIFFQFTILFQPSI